ncbi:MAG: hypothetical protein ABTR07_18470, partial [Candidatus Competibacter denitrificans]
MTPYRRAPGFWSPFCLLVLLYSPVVSWGACDDPPAQRVNWLACDKQGVDLQGIDLRGAVLTQV